MKKLLKDLWILASSYVVSLIVVFLTYFAIGYVATKNKKY